MMPKLTQTDEPVENVPVSGVVSLPTPLMANLSSLLVAEFGHRLTPQRVRSVFNAIRSRKLLDYHRDAISFAYLYFGANYAKAYLVFRRAFQARRESLRSGRPNGSSSHVLNVVDLGAGSGATSAAVLQAAADSGVTIGQLIAVDRSSVQLDLFRKLTLAWSKVRFPETSVSLLQDDALTHLSQFRSDPSTLVVTEYLRAELGDRTPRYDEEIERIAREGSKIIEIDQLGAPQGTFVRTAPWSWHRIPSEAIVFEAGPIARLPLPHLPKAAGPISAEELPRIVSDYFSCWVTHDNRKLREVFCPNASYTIHRVGRNSVTITGIEQLESYWRQNAQEQRDVRWKAGFVQSDRENALTFCWSAEFNRIDRDLHYELSGRMTFVMKNEMISQFEESFQVDLSAVPADQTQSIE